MGKKLICLVVAHLIAAPALAVPVDPDATNGVAAEIFLGADSHYWALTTSGDTWRLYGNHSDGWENMLVGLPPGVGVADIADWNILWVITHDGTIWRNDSIHDPNGWSIAPPFPGGTVPSESSSLTDLKARFR
jgi:hypothetical protein